MEFEEPDAEVSGSKGAHLNMLIAAGANIASTHELFRRITGETARALRGARYALVVDEETEWSREYEMRPDDIRGMFAAEYVYRDDKDRVRWNYEKWPTYNGNKYAEVKELADKGALVFVNDELMIWEMPREFLELFEEVYVLTYLFEGSVLSAYMRANDIPYMVKTLDADSNLVDIDGGNERRVKAELRELVTVVDSPKLNAVGRRHNALSKSWYSNDMKVGGRKVKELQANTYDFFTNYVDSPGRENLWSCFKTYDGKSALSDHLKGKRYTRQWTPVNLRGTNKYMHCRSLAYLANIYIRPRLRQYFRDCGYEPNDDLYALSQLVQWVWRSRIRQHRLPDGERTISLYLPSARMRRLFLNWLHDRALDTELDPVTGKALELKHGTGTARE